MGVTGQTTGSEKSDSTTKRDKSAAFEQFKNLGRSARDSYTTRGLFKDYSNNYERELDLMESDIRYRDRMRLVKRDNVDKTEVKKQREFYASKGISLDDFIEKFRKLYTLLRSTNYSDEKKYEVFKNSIILALGYYGDYTRHVSTKYFLISHIYKNFSENVFYLFVGSKCDYNNLLSDCLDIGNAFIFAIVLDSSHFTLYHLYMNRRHRVCTSLLIYEMPSIYDSFEAVKGSFKKLYYLRILVSKNLLESHRYNKLLSEVINEGTRRWDDGTIDWHCLFEFVYKLIVQKYDLSVYDLRLLLHSLGYDTNGLYYSDFYQVVKVPYIEIAKQEISQIRSCVRDLDSFSRVCIYYADTSNTLRGRKLRSIMSKEAFDKLGTLECDKVFVFSSSEVLVCTCYSSSYEKYFSTRHKENKWNNSSLDRLINWHSKSLLNDVLNLRYTADLYNVRYGGLSSKNDSDESLNYVARTLMTLSVDYIFGTGIGKDWYNGVLLK